MSGRTSLLHARTHIHRDEEIHVRHVSVVEERVLVLGLHIGQNQKADIIATPHVATSRLPLVGHRRNQRRNHNIAVLLQVLLVQQEHVQRGGGEAAHRSIHQLLQRLHSLRVALGDGRVLLAQLRDAFRVALHVEARSLRRRQQHRRGNLLVTTKRHVLRSGRRSDRDRARLTRRSRRR